MTPEQTESVDPIVPVVNPATETVPQPQAEAQENQGQIDWRKFREERERQRKQEQQQKANEQSEYQKNVALQNALNAALDKKLASQNQGYVQTEEDDIDKRIEARVNAKVAELEKRNQEERARLELQRLPSEHQDFNKVCSQENMDYLEFHYPHLVQSFNSQPDTYQKWKGIYETAKKLIPNKDAAAQNARADYNQSKPKPLSSVASGSVIAEKSGSQFLSEADKRAIYENAQRKLKGY